MSLDEWWLVMAPGVYLFAFYCWEYGVRLIVDEWYWSRWGL